jgi:hypothetical protein
LQLTIPILNDLNFGFDTRLTPAKFYDNPKLESYYCDKIEDDTATLYLVESYQHGKLLQSKLKLLVENQKI